MVIELRVVQFWSEIATRSFDFEITRMISDQIALHSVQLPLFILYKLNQIDNLSPASWKAFTFFFQFFVQLSVVFRFLFCLLTYSLTFFSFFFLFTVKKVVVGGGGGGGGGS